MEGQGYAVSEVSFDGHVNGVVSMHQYCVPVCVARTVDGQRRRGPGKPGDDTQMMSEFGKDPNADLMDSTRGIAV